MALKVLYSAEKTKGYGLLFQPFSHMTMALFGTSLAIKRWLHLLILEKKILWLRLFDTLHLFSTLE